MSDYEESEIEASFDYCGNFMNVDKARVELAALRAQAAEAETLRGEREQWGKDFSALMEQISHLDDVLNDTDECEAWSGCADIAEQFDPWESIRVMVETAKTLRATVAAQARQLEQARVAIEAAMDYLESLEYSGHCYQLLLNWYSGSFAANAPAQTKAEEIS